MKIEGKEKGSSRSDDRHLRSGQRWLRKKEAEIQDRRSKRGNVHNPEELQKLEFYAGV